MKDSLRLFLFALLCPFLLQAQGPVCGTEGAWAKVIAKRLLANKRAYQAQPVRLRSTEYIPVKFHLVAQNNGSGRVLESRVLDQLCAMNEDFADIDIQFYIRDGLNYLDNSAVYSNHSSTINTIMTFEFDPEAMNIWIVDNAAPDNNNDLGITLGYYDPTKDWIVVNKDFIGEFSSILTHEVGHFFSLLHPHNGWEEPWEETIHGNPAPATSPGGVPTEKMDGSNCDSAGDFICDTPPDYNGLGWPNCNYEKGARDPDSTLIDPDESNFMSYFLNCPRERYRFSQEQKSMMLTDLINPDGPNGGFPTPSREHLRAQNPTNTTPITELPELVSPIDEVRAPGGGTVRLEWSAVEGADSYIVEVDRSPTFVIDPQRFVANSNFLDVTNLTVDRRYFWRVRAFNESFTCTDFTNPEAFIVGEGTATNNIDFVTDWSVSPNPVRRGNELNLNMESSRSFEAELNMFSITGQVVRSLGNQRIQTGANSLQIPVHDLSPGVYLLSLVAPEGRLNTRVVVTE